MSVMSVNRGIWNWSRKEGGWCSTFHYCKCFTLGPVNIEVGDKQKREKMQYKDPLSNDQLDNIKKRIICYLFPVKYLMKKVKTNKQTNKQDIIFV